MEERATETAANALMEEELTAMMVKEETFEEESFALIYFRLAAQKPIWYAHWLRGAASGCVPALVPFGAKGGGLPDPVMKSRKRIKHRAISFSSSTS